MEIRQRKIRATEHSWPGRNSKYPFWLFCQLDKGRITEDQDGEGNGTPLQYSCLENPMGGEAWWAAGHGVVKSRTRLSDFTFTHWRRKWQPTPVFFPGESQGRGSLVGCHLWGHTESDTTEVTQQQQDGKRQRIDFISLVSNMILKLCRRTQEAQFH